MTKKTKMHLDPDSLDLKCNMGVLLAAHNATGGSSSRMYLNYMLLEPHPEGGIIVVATNGTVLVCHHDKTAIMNQPRALLRLPKMFRKSKLWNRRFSVEQGLCSVQDLDLAFGVRGCFALNGYYPGWRSTLPKMHDLTDAFPPINEKLLNKIGKSVNLNPGIRGIVLRKPAGDDTGPLVVFPADGAASFGLVMPKRKLGGQTQSKKLFDYQLSMAPLFAGEKQ